MGYWKFIVPSATTNYALNPIWGEDSGYTAEAGTVVSQSSSYAKWGLYSLSVTANADNEGVEIDLDPNGLANLNHYVTMAVRGTITGAWDWSLDDANWTTPTELMDLDGSWTLYGALFNGAQSLGSTTLHVHQDGAGSLELYIDGIQVEQDTTWSTLCYGGAEGCEWNGPEHASTSSRSAQSRAGGYVYDFEDDYSFHIVDWQGWGVPPHSLNLDPYAILPGASLNSIKTDVNTLTLTGYFSGSSLSNLHTLRQALVEELAHDRYPKTASGWQPIHIWYTGATVAKEAKAFYDSGLEGSGMVGRGFTETMLVRFLMADPFWYEIGESAKALDYYNSSTLRYLAGRLKDTGEWDDMGLTANPASDGIIYDVLVTSDSSVYFGGNYDGLNNDGAPADAGCDMICRYDPEDETFNVLVGASDVGDIVYCISEGPDGTIYLGGEFTAVNGVASADYVVSYDPDADTWSSLGDPDSGAAAITDVRAMAWDSDGNLYVGGDFTNFADVANADYFAKWDGTSWSAVGSGGTGRVNAIAIDSDDNIYIGGNFTNWATDGDADYWAWWNGTAWAAVDDIALSAQVWSLEFNDQDELFVGGSFTNANSVSNADYIFKWTGKAVEALDTGTNGAVYRALIAPDGLLWVSGAFTIAGSLSTIDRLAIWNGSAWVPADVNLSGTPIITALAFGKPDPVIPSNYDVYIGFNTTGTAYYANSTTTPNDGTAAQYPIFVIERSGGTSARLVSIRNWTTGQELYCDYALLDGERIVIDCRPGQKTLASSFFAGRSYVIGPPPSNVAPRGNRALIILPGSDFGSFRLQSGNNNITLFVDYAGAPTITSYALWQDAYRGMD